jgi:hypothetical protein
MDEIISVMLLLFIFFGGGHILYARGCQIFKYGPANSTTTLFLQPQKIVHE